MKRSFGIRIRCLSIRSWVVTLRSCTSYKNTSLTSNTIRSRWLSSKESMIEWCWSLNTSSRVWLGNPHPPRMSRLRNSLRIVLTRRTQMFTRLIPSPTPSVPKWWIVNPANAWSNQTRRSSPHYSLAWVNTNNDKVGLTHSTSITSYILRADQVWSLCPKPLSSPSRSR